jgi:hypothetical protein
MFTQFYQDLFDITNGAADAAAVKCENTTDGGSCKANQPCAAFLTNPAKSLKDFNFMIGVKGQEKRVFIPLTALMRNVVASDSTETCEFMVMNVNPDHPMGS